MNIIGLLVMMMMPALGLASDAGYIEAQTLQSILTGNIGLFLGLLITIWGIWKAFVQGETGGGLVIMICGVLLTIFPGVYNTAYNLISPIVGDITGR